MKLTDHEQKLLLRALDAASAATEAEKAAAALIASLRKRAINGFDILDQFKQTAQTQAGPRPNVTPDDDVTSDYDYAEGLRRARESAQEQYAKEQAEQEAILQEINFWDWILLRPLEIIVKTIAYGFLGLFPLSLIIAFIGTLLSHSHL
jgi:hypothetical protein